MENVDSETKEVDVVKVEFKLYNNKIRIIESISIPTICAPLQNQRTVKVARKYRHFNDIKLADYRNEDFQVSNQKKEDLLIGIDNYLSFVTGSIKKGGPTEPCAVETVFGCVLCGESNCLTLTNMHTQAYTQFLFANSQSISWKQIVLSTKNPFTTHGYG